jgi:3-oxoadipate enol-lactonase
LAYSDNKGNYCPVQEGNLFFLKEGSGPPLVFIHGFCLDHRMWENQVNHFSKKYTCITLDLRGFGKSSVPTDQSFSNHEDLNDLFEFLKFDEAVILVGLSMGARVTSNFAITFPEKTRAIIFADAAIDGFAFKNFNLAYIYETGKKEGIEVANKLWIDHPIFDSTRNSLPVRESLTQIVMSYSGWHWINKNPIRNLTPPALEQLQKLRMPCLILIGELDIPDFKSIADILNKQIKNSIKLEMQNVGHMCNMESPDKFNELLDQFLSSAINYPGNRF